MKIINSVDLYNKEFEPMTFVVDELLSEGLNVIAGLPKSGKSWFALSLCSQVSRGEPFLDFKTLQSEVLYLCLEGGEKRLRKRYRELTNNPSTNLSFTLEVKKLNCGFKEEIEEYLKDHPTAKLIVIDTWQKIRDGSNAISSYQNDYNEMQELRELTEKYSICILLVHHTRKMHDDDPFNMIAGTTGFTGAVDNMYVLINDKSKESKQVKLHITGRDIKDMVLDLESDPKTHEWTLNYIENENNVDFPEDILFHKIVELMEYEKEFNDTPMELTNKLKEVCGYEISERSITKGLNKYKEFLELKNINFFSKRTGQGRSIFLKKMD